jgi:hypothetical protein
VIARAPVVLDLDGSLGSLPARLVLPLREWEESLRFAATWRAMRRFGAALDAILPERHGPVFMGSGDFHHLSLPLIERRGREGRFQVVVLDNHPDNMRFAWGVHCGSWVRRVAALDQVSHVHVLGITSGDIGARHAWENYLAPLRRGKLTYWSLNVDVSWARRLGLAARFRSFATADELVDAFGREYAQEPTYLSIDKDVFAPDVARTNWDQGVFGEDHALAVIRALEGNLVGSDITGEISAYRYRNPVKRWLSALDDQPLVGGAELAGWQSGQHALNLRLLEALRA